MDWAGIGSAVGGFISSPFTSAMNVHESRQNRRFQRDMSNTAHQREVADLKKAGLNPILSSKYGGESTPSGSTSQSADPVQAAGNVYSSATSARQSSASTDLIKSQTRKTNAEAQSAETQAGINSATKLWIEQQIKNVSDKSLAELGSAQNQEVISRAEQEFAQKTLADKISLFKNLVPKSSAESNMYKTWFGKYLAPYLNSSKSVMDITGSLVK